MSKKFKNNPAIKFYLELGFVLLSFLLVLISLLADFKIIPIPSFISLTITDKENLFFTLFTVQASVSTVSIAIVSIITGLINENILGISVSGFITSLKPRILKHRILIITNLILILINYISLSFSLFNLCIAIFTISILITILLVKEICVVFLGKDKIRIEIENYVLENYNKLMLIDINQEFLSAIDNGNTIVVNEDLKIIKTLFEQEIKRHNYSVTDITEQLSVIISDGFEKTVQKQNTQKSNDYLVVICEIYQLANSNEDNPLHLDIWYDIATNYFRVLKEFTIEQIIDERVCFNLHTELLKNLKGRKIEQIEASDLKYYSSWLYSSLIIENNILSDKEKERIKKDIYDVLNLALYFRNFNKDDKNLNSLLIYEMCNLHKRMITNGDIEGMEDLFLTHGFNYNERESQVVIYLTTIIYLYYLSSREDLLKGNILQENAIKLLNINSKHNSCFYINVNLFHIIDNYLPLMRTILKNWEHYEEDVKWVVMNYVIDDFFIFFAIVKYWDKDSINKVVEKIAPQTMFPIYERYFSKDDGTTVKKLFSEFETLFTSIKDENFINEKISLLKDVFNERYRNEIILEGEHEKITNEQENWLSQKFTDFIKETVNGTLSPFLFKSEDEQTALTFDVQKAPIFRLILTGFFFKDSEYVDEFVKKHLLSIIINTFLKSLSSHIEVKEVSYKDKDKQSTLIKMVNSLSISPTTVIGNRDEFWGEESADLLKNYTSQMDKIKFADGYNCFYILDYSLIEFSLDNIKIEYDNLTWADIEDDCRKNEDGSILYNVTNEIYLPFTQNELEQHIANTKRKLIIYADIKVRLKKDKVGAGIIIVPE